MNKYQLKAGIQVWSQYLNCSIDPGFQGVNRPFVLSNENNGFRAVYTRYFLTTIKIKDYNVMIDARNFFDQPV